MTDLFASNFARARDATTGLEWSLQWCNGITRSVLCCLSLSNVCSVIMHSDYTLSWTKCKLFDAGWLGQIVRFWYEFDHHSVTQTWIVLNSLLSSWGGIYFHQLFDSVLCLICIFCNIDRKSVDLFQPKIPENSILFKIIIRSWWATKSISKVQSMHCFIVCCAFKLRVDKIFLHFQVMYVVIVRRISETFQTIWSRPLMFVSPSRFLQFKQFDYYSVRV